MSPPTESKLFSPLQIGPYTLTHRIIMAPLTRLRVNKDHIPLSTSMVAEHYSQRSSEPGQRNLIIAESNIISADHGGAAHMPGIWTQDQISAWRTVVDAVHANGGYIFAQLIALGRVADASQLRSGRVVGASDLPFTEGPGSIPHALSEDEITSTVQDFAQAARNAVYGAGFDGIEIHGANGYLVDQFTQDVTNRRSDAYGGSIPNRSRFAVQVAQACAEAVGKDKVGFRISPFSAFQGMKMADPVSQFSDLVEKLKKLQLAYLHIVESRVVNSVDCEKTEGIEPFLKIWGRTSPVLVAGGFTSKSAKFAVDEEYKENEVGVVFGRHFIANPDLPFRVRYGLELNKYDRSTFYAPEERRGYLDCPFSEEYGLRYGKDGQYGKSGRCGH
ncbi:Putative NADH:flavin oxidoreductase/NADH oxidase, aldolase-type TIM barrel, oxidoreductase Oye [Septoria linicola]|uniref:NADH:flavin oxidoreductase/NADH oxidase, aldolase-type TIM barrel, oxidoreductase Oye n=1 Tax=Septoria linicola TaxID=215465 RepID=A0A9Q9EI11_9PEZI|nr:putative NADH:flavin oxidoreductase/NADH oxidase, aldolase-type TIM barrel, oxidoreductase Oye [Septoria linicola]USW51540.1 Putative NADH:flavin oxidoreductase/NADH oxidase, aldolase-type TIM barrel, oxidoreductase Oye [Septoria linicola]